MINIIEGNKNKFFLLTDNEGIKEGEIDEQTSVITNAVVDKFTTKEELNYHIATRSVSSYPPLPEAGRIFEKYYSWNGKIVKCIKEHDRMHFAPDQTPALFNIIDPIQEGYPAWKQPTGAHDAYKIGDRVTYNGKDYESRINANTTKPDGDIPYNRYWKPL